MNTNHIASLVTLSSLALLPACGADPQPTPTATVSGVVEIDDAIQNATVFIDLDGNNLLDSGEPQVATDATGHYTLTWDNSGPVVPHAIGAIVNPDSTRVGVAGNPAVGFALHLRSPLGDTSGDFVGTAVISPFTTLVVSEMGYDPSLTRAAAEAKVSSALSASQLPFSGQPLDVMADYASDYKAGTPTSADSVQLRYAAGAVGAIVSSAVDAVNAAQSTIDCNDATYFDPAIAAMDHQLTGIANGTFKFSQLTSAEQTDVEQSPSNYRGYFIDTSALATDIENELAAAALDIAAEVFAELEAKFVEQLEDAVVEIVAEELIGEILGA
jgi:hypothetical protein